MNLEGAAGPKPISPPDSAPRAPPRRRTTSHIGPSAADPPPHHTPTRAATGSHQRQASRPLLLLIAAVAWLPTRTRRLSRAPPAQVRPGRSLSTWGRKRSLMLHPKDSGHCLEADHHSTRFSVSDGERWPGRVDDLLDRLRRAREAAGQTGVVGVGPADVVGPEELLERLDDRAAEPGVPGRCSG
jgi:hypothetical protein